MTAYFYTYNAIFDAPVSGAARLAYAYLCKCAGRNGKCRPSHKAIADAAGVCVTTVKKALAELERAGLIAVRGQARPGAGRVTNLYTIIKEAVKGFFVTYVNVFSRTLTAKARLVYLYFCRLASGRKSCGFGAFNQAFPAHRTTAAACGLSVSGARLAIDELEAAGLTSRQAQYRDNGGQKSNLYTLTDPQGVSGGGNAPDDEISDENDNIYAETAPVGADGAALETETALSADIDTAAVPVSAAPRRSPPNRKIAAERAGRLPEALPRFLKRLRIRFAAAPDYVLRLTFFSQILYWLSAGKSTRTEVKPRRNPPSPLQSSRGRRGAAMELNP
jgi:predicted ArsR family transcriptional regulator